MTTSTHTKVESAASLDKLETQLAACSINESDSIGDVAKIDSDFTNLWNWSSESDTSTEDGIVADTDTSAPSQPSSDYFSLPKAGARRTSHPFGGPWTYQNILVLTPSSVGPSSPTSPVSPDGSEPEQPQQPRSSIQGLISSLLALPLTHSLTRSLESAILSHLHSTPATLADVQALVPTLSSHPTIPATLTTNIGLFHARGAVSSGQVEDMLIHMLTSASPSFMTLTHSSLTHFPSPKQRRKIHTTLASTRALAEKADHRRWLTMPRALREHSDFVPCGCENIADLYVQEGMGWKEVQRVMKFARLAREKRMGVVVVGEGVGKETFAVTRMHNGPGLMDRRRPRVRMPVAWGGGKGEVGKEVSGGGGGEDVEVVSKAGEEGLFGEEVCVRLPPY